MAMRICTRRWVAAGWVAARCLRSRRGAALVEFTLVAPLLFVLAAAFVEGGRLLWQHHEVEQYARNAARLLARLPTQTPVADATFAVADAALGGLLTTTASVKAADLADMTVSIDYPVATGIETESGSATFDVPKVRVRLRQPYAELGMMGLLGIEDLEVLAAHEEPYIGE